MQPVDQCTKDDCFAACIASILEIRGDQIPNFCGGSTPNENWLFEADKWLRENYGLTILGFRPRGESAVYSMPGVYHIMSGQSPRGLLHSVVAFQGKMVHDPHPSKEGIEEPTEYDFLFPADERFEKYLRVGLLISK